MKRKLGPYLCQLSPEARERIVKRLNAPIPITIKVYLDGKHLFSRKISMKPGSSEGAVLLAAVEQSEIKRKLSEGFKAEPGIFHPDKSLTVRLKEQPQRKADKSEHKPESTVTKTVPPETGKKEVAPQKPKKVGKPSPWVILLLIGLAVWGGIKWVYPRFAAELYFRSHEAYTRTIDSDFADVVAVRQDHTMLYSYSAMAWYQDEASQWNNIQSVSTSGEHVLALMSDGTVRARGAEGLEALNVSDWTDLVKIVADTNLSLGLHHDGTVEIEGAEEDDSIFDVTSWTGIVDLDSSGGYVVGVRFDGTVVFSGFSDSTLFSETPASQMREWNSIARVSVGGRNRVAGLREDGTVTATGDYADLVSSWTSIQDLVFSYSGDLLVGLRFDGTVVTAAVPDSVSRTLHETNPYDNPIDVSGWTDIAEIACSAYGVIGVHSDGTVVTAAWEENDHLAEAETWTDILTK